MPRADRFSHKARTSILGKAIESQMEKTSSLLNAIDFIESPQGLNVKLYPVQRVIVKSLFGVPMDYKEGMVPVHDVFCEKLLYTFTESEYLHYVFSEGRCNVDDWRDMPADGFNEAAIFAGRRGGKSQVVSAIGAYALYKLLNVRSPQEYFGLVPGSPIDFTFMAQDDEGSSRLYDKLREDIIRSPFFAPYLKTQGATAMGFITEADRDKREPTPTIQVASYPCTTNAARGLSSLFLALDEFAHFRSAKGSSSDEVYDAATPATMQFKNPDNEREAMILSISSPMKKVGKMYDLHKHALDKGVASGIFTLRCGSAEMNPRSDAAFLRQKYEVPGAQLTWKAEYGGQFLESSESYVTEAQIVACTDADRPNVPAFTVKNIGRQYFWFIDLGMIHDATALAIAHLEFRSSRVGIELVYDYIDRMLVGEKFEGPGVKQIPGEQKYLRYESLDLDDILDWMDYLNKIYPCFRGGTDQHGGQQLVQLLELRKIYGVELINLTPSLNSRMYFALKGFIEKTRAHFPTNPKFSHELKNIEAEFTNKYQIRVQAPAEKGAHDDMCDVAAGCAMLAADWINDEKHLLLDPSGQSLLQQERQGAPPGVVANIDGISMADLKTLSRASEIRKGFGVSGPTPPPWSRRRGRR